MIIISYGITKAGSTLAFRMAEAVLELNGYAQGKLSADLIDARRNINFVDRWSEERLRRLVEGTRGTRVVVKTHGGPAPGSAKLVSEYLAGSDLRIHAVFRDPRDTVLAMIDAGIRARRSGDAGFSEIRVLDDAIASIGRQLQNLREWGWFPSLKLRYEDFAFDPTIGPAMISDDLGLPADPAEVWEIVNRRFTQKNVARPERYKTELSLDEIARVEQAFPLYLDVVRGNPPPGWFVRSR